MEKGFSRICWMGKPILDLDAFCKEHDTKMVKVKHTWEEIDLYRIIKRVEIEEMPLLFFECLTYGGPNRDIYSLIKE